MSKFDELREAYDAGLEERRVESNWAEDFVEELHKSFVEYLGCDPEKLVLPIFDDMPSDALISIKERSLYLRSDGYWHVFMYLRLPGGKIDLNLEFRRHNQHLEVHELFFDVRPKKKTREYPDILFLEETFFPAPTFKMVEKLKLPMDLAYKQDLSVLKMFQFDSSWSTDR